MDSFTKLESSALRRLAENYPDQEAGLLQAFRLCGITGRENTGRGFFTRLAPDRSLPPIAFDRLSAMHGSASRE